jgi:hypothetical protein
MTTLPHGVVDGLTWYELPEDAKGRRIVVVTIGEKMPTLREIRDIMASPLWQYGLHAHALPWFRPFDLEGTFPDRLVLFRENRFDAATITAWMNEHLDVPAELDLSLEPGSRGGLQLIARTMRKGMTTLVRKRMDTSIPIREALARHLPGLLRTSRRADVRPGHRCRSHLNALLAEATDHAVGMISRWLADHDPDRLATRSPDALKIPGGLVRARGVEEVRLMMDVPSSTVLASVTIEGGHSLMDDATGIEVRIAKELPDSVRLALPGRSLRDVVDLAWVENVLIRTTRECSNGESTMRASCDGAPFEIPKGGGLTHDEAVTLIAASRASNRYGTPQIATIAAGAMPAFDGMDIGSFATALALLPMPGVLDMRHLGREGWVLRNRGGDIIAEESPNVPVDEALGTILGGLST